MTENEEKLIGIIQKLTQNSCYGWWFTWAQDEQSKLIYMATEDGINKLTMDEFISLLDKKSE